MVEDSGAMPRLYKDSYYFDEPLVFAVEFHNFILIWFLVSTAVQRLHLSEFEFLCQVCEYFHVARHLIKQFLQFHI